MVSVRASPLWVLMVVLVGCSYQPPPSRATSSEPMTAERHSAFFPLTSGAHAGVGCEGCHSAGTSFLEFSCTGCHVHAQAQVDPLHLGRVEGYTFGPRTCVACHPQGASTGFDHETHFPIGPRALHHDVVCAQCHLDRDNRKVLGCAECHTPERTDPPHAIVPDYTHESRACYGCHPKATIPLDGIDHSAFFPIDATATHGGLGCASCHPVAQDKKVFACTPCHTHEKPGTDLIHNGIAAYRYESASCYSCHPKAQVVGLIDHSPFFPIGPGAKHAGLTCASCHPTPGNRKAVACVSCHTHEKTRTDATHARVAGYAYASAACLSCHPQATVGTSVNHESIFPIATGTKHAGLACASCHTVPSDRKVVACASSCHAQQQTNAEHAGVRGYRYDSAQCRRCHADAQVYRVAQHSRWVNHRNAQCLQCHPALRTDKPFGANFTLAAMSCAACHERARTDNQHRGRQGYTYEPFSGCLRCH